jgi:serine/threonine-protein kinase
MSKLRPGAMLTPKIRLQRSLAAGGMGTVWIAHHLGLDTTVVVKFMAEDLADDPELVARFSREAAAAAQLRSPHVVQMLDHGVSTGGIPYIAMELLEGCPLSAHLAAVTHIPPKQAANVVAQVAKALGRAHERGVVHRDIKPDNIFLCDAGGGEAFVKVLDFGIAKLSSGEGLAETKTGAVLGTPYYMSPEQVLGAKSVDLRADLWALAVVAYEMLVGIRPFVGETVGAVSVRIHGVEYARPSLVDAELPRALDEFFALAFARELDRRFASARALAEAFEQAAGGTEVLRLARPSRPAGAPRSGSEPPPSFDSRADAATSPGEIVPGPRVSPAAASIAVLGPSPGPSPELDTKLGYPSIPRPRPATEANTAAPVSARTPMAPSEGEPAPSTRGRGLAWPLVAAVIAAGAIGAFALTRRPPTPDATRAGDGALVPSASVATSASARTIPEGSAAPPATSTSASASVSASSSAATRPPATTTASARASAPPSASAPTPRRTDDPEMY